MNQNVEIRNKGKGKERFTGRTEEKGWKGMKLKLGFWIGEEKRVSELTTFPPPMVDITWQSPYIMCMHRLRHLLPKSTVSIVLETATCTNSFCQKNTIKGFRFSLQSLHSPQFTSKQFQNIQITELRKYIENEITNEKKIMQNLSEKI